MEEINGFIGQLKPLAELLYFISAIGLAIFAYIGLQQISILKSTAATQAKRDALKLTSEQCSYYSDKIIPRQNEFHRKIKEHNVKFFEGWTVAVQNNQIVASRSKPNVLPDFDKALDSLDFLNLMESFSTYFTSRVADEAVAYNSVGVTFLGACEDVMPWILTCRKSGYFKNLVKLYILWRTRSDKEKLLLKKLKIDKELAETMTTIQSPIGTGAD
ncbi:hypothetical protein [Pseudomonas sp. Au-Pse12]|uniref:hypothetical protein n=1 Tax=Pseudomonas sp. Au-Pse12 TaxID=2906459 RepID=UPI001E41B3C9|nr:hypothetical protein [Pseudomonas sp. Au-Pse12]MCE4057097.1 hypothetical protein [Pseudomonas sp. Au-Pse12]